MDYSLAPLLNAAALNSHHGIEQLIQQQPPPPPFAYAAAAAPAPASSDDEEIIMSEPPPPPTKQKKKANKKKSPNNSNTTNTLITTTPLNLNHPDSDTHKLQTNQQLLDTATRIEDAISELEGYADLLAADGLKLQHRPHNSRSASAHHIRSSIVPLLQITANTLREAGKCFAPFPGTGRLYERNDIARKRKLMEGEGRNNNQNQTLQAQAQTTLQLQNVKRSPALIMIDDFVKRSNWSPPPQNNTAAKSSASTSPKKRKAGASAAAAKSNKKSAPTTLKLTLLQPRNGSTYTKSEAIAIAKQYKKGETGRRQIINAMVERGFIPVHRRSVDRLIKKMENGEIVLDDDWHIGVGRPYKLYPEHMKPKPVDGNLTFHDLDTGDNRIVVEYEKNKKRQKTEEEGDGDGGEEEEEVEEEDEDDNAVDGGDQKPSHKRYTPPKKKKWVINPNVIAFELPPPRDGSKLYKTTEFVEVIKPFIATNDHHVAIRAAMYRGYVGAASKRSLTALVKKAEKGDHIFDTEWTAGRRGRPPVVSTDEINTMVERIKEEDLRVYDNGDVNRLMVEALMKKGVVDQAKLTFCNKTVADYFTVLKSKLSPLYWKKLDGDDDDDDDDE